MLRIEDELKNNQISRFQLLYGEERYMVQYYRNQLIEKLSNPDDEMNRTFFRDKPEPSQIAEAAQILPFFAENRLIVVEDSGYFKSSSDMADYVESFPETTYIIFVEREIDKRNRLFKWINKNGCVTECTRQPEHMLKRWIAGYMKKAGKSISTKGAERLIERVGNKIQYSPVKQYALEQNLPLLQPEKLKDEAFVQALREWKADLQIVVAFRMLPEVVWSMPRLGTFNLHASLLPQYRGAAPINWAVINGDTETGITTFFLKHEIDTGEVIQQVRVPIADTDNVEIVHDKLMMLGGKLVVETVDAILNGVVKPVPQEEMAIVGELRPAPKIFKETCRIDWNQPVKKVYDFIRGLSPYPAAWSELVSPEGEVVVVKIFESEKVSEAHQLSAGTIVTDGKKYIKVAVPDGFVSVLSLQLPGKKRLKTDELLRGFRLTNEYKMN